MNSKNLIFSIIIIKEFKFKITLKNMIQEEEENKIVFIRHAESLSNRAVHNFR
jgi:hypothetical protein